MRHFAETTAIEVLLIASCLVPLPLVAAAQSAPSIDGKEPPPAIPNLSAELLDPDGHSRFHLVTRASFSDGDKVFTGTTLFSLEARAHLRVSQGLALTAVLPFGLASSEGAPSKFFFGNLSVGVGGGARIRLTSQPWDRPGAPLVRIGGALDVYAPTAPKADDDPELARVETAVALMRAYEPELYLSDRMTFRARAHASFSITMFEAELELGLAPSFTLKADSDFLMWFSAGTRLSAKLIPALEPFIEIGSAIQVLGAGDFSPPLRLTPGLRFHIPEANLDPAVFVSINFENGASLIFGLDLAGALRPSPRTDADGIEEFFGEFK